SAYLVAPSTRRYTRTGADLPASPRDVSGFRRTPEAGLPLIPAIPQANRRLAIVNAAPSFGNSAAWVATLFTTLAITIDSASATAQTPLADYTPVTDETLLKPAAGDWLMWR